MQKKGDFLMARLVRFYVVCCSAVLLTLIGVGLEYIDKLFAIKHWPNIYNEMAWWELVVAGLIPITIVGGLFCAVFGAGYGLFRLAAWVWSGSRKEKP